MLTIAGGILLAGFIFWVFSIAVIGLLSWIFSGTSKMVPSKVSGREFTYTRPHSGLGFWGK